eukprot:m.78348 g.78348  ORF g.78348 m.78348 type:complete len:54 (-) comp16226_c0_seq1:967-1128(-)
MQKCGTTVFKSEHGVAVYVSDHACISSSVNQQHMAMTYARHALPAMSVPITCE